MATELATGLRSRTSFLVSWICLWQIGSVESLLSALNDNPFDNISGIC